MNKIAGFFLLIALSVTLCGCNKKSMVENHISFIESNEKSGYILKSLDIEKDYDIECIRNDNIIYSKYEDNGTLLRFYQYNLDKNATYNLGKVKNPYIYSGDLTGVGNKIFLYCNELINNSDTPDGKVQSSLYQIDLSKNNLQKIAEDSVEQTLLYLNAADNKILSFKGEKDGNKGISYIDSLDIAKGSKPEFKVLIEKEYDNEKNIGEVFYHFAVYESNIYVLVIQRESLDNQTGIIEKFDLSGNYISSISIDKKTANLLKNERISKFEIFGKYGFIENFSNSGAVFKISSEITTPILVRNTESDKDLDISISSNHVNASNIIFFSRDTGEVWCLNKDKSIFCSLDLPYEYLNCIYTDGNKILISADDIIYGEIDKMPKKSENLLKNIDE